MKFNRYLLLLLLPLATSYSDAEFPSLEEIEANEEYRLKIDYQKKTCLFVDEKTDYATKNDCFHILNRLYELTANKVYLYHIAKHYFNGYGVTQNLKKGLRLMEKLANSDHEYAVQAQATLGIYYGAHDSPSSVKNSVKAEYWIKKAAENGDGDSQYAYAKIIKDKGKFKDALHWYKKAALNGSLIAKYKLGEFFNEGYSVELNREQIYKLLHEAAEQGYAPAFQELYFLYASDDNCEKAKFWYNKFINSDCYKKIQSGINPNDAIFEIYKEQKKKAYIEEVKKEMEEIEKQSSKKTKSID